MMLCKGNEENKYSGPDVTGSSRKQDHAITNWKYYVHVLLILSMKFNKISGNITYLPQKVDKFLECAGAAAFFSTKRTIK